MTFLYKADPVHGAHWGNLFAARAPDILFHIWPDTGNVERVRYLAGLPSPDIERQFPNLEILFSTGASFDEFDFAALPPDLPVVRMAEPNLIAGMVEHVTLAVLALQRNLPACLRQQRQERWAAHRVHPASKRRVSVLGMGELGCAVLQQLRSFGFQLAGWSHARREMEGVSCYAGQEELPSMLASSGTLVCLTPLANAMPGILDAALLRHLPRGAALVHVGRRTRLDHRALLDALETGGLSRAVVDVSDPEPEPADYPLWTHPGILLTPHFASIPQLETAMELVLDNIRRHQAGAPLVGLVDRSRCH